MNPYSDVIDILKDMTPEQAIEIVYAVAKKSPGVISKAAENPEVSTPLNGDNVKHTKDLINAVLSFRKITATKAIRCLTGLGIREAKDIVDEYMS